MCCRMNCFSPERCELAVKSHKRRIISSWVFLNSGLFLSANFSWHVACMMQQTYRKHFLLEGDFNTIWAASWQNQQSGYAPNEDLDQPGHPPSLLRAFACVQWVAKVPTFLHADSEDSDQTGWMPRLIWVFTGRTATLLVLSWGGSFWKNHIFCKITTKFLKSSFSPKIRNY